MASEISEVDLGNETISIVYAPDICCESTTLLTSKPCVDERRRVQLQHNNKSYLDGTWATRCHLTVEYD